MSTSRFPKFSRARRYDADPVEQRVAELQALTGADISVRRIQFGRQWEARVDDRRWRMGSRQQLMMEVLDHLSQRARSAESRSEAAGSDHVVLDLTDRRTVDRSLPDPLRDVADVTHPVEETGP